MSSVTVAPRHRLAWWKEALYVAAFYAVYSVIRNQFGSAAVSEAGAFANAIRVIDVEVALSSYHEPAIQAAFLGWTWFVQAVNIFYGTAHFAVTAFAIVYLFRRFPDRYVRWRTTLAATTALALVGYATFPLLPPRLLPDSFGYVDTLAVYGGLWSFDSGAMQAVSNQYAAMPSLHAAWSMWCAIVLVPTLSHHLAKAAAALYPVVTLFVIVVTANHYWLDAAGGYLVLGLGAAVGWWWADRTPSSRGLFGRNREKVGEADNSSWGSTGA